MSELDIQCVVCGATNELSDTPVQIEETDETKQLWLCPDHLNDLERYNKGKDVNWEEWKEP